MTAARFVVRGAALGACALAAHTAVNLVFLRSPDLGADEVAEDVSVLIPARNEEAHLEATIRSVLAQTGVPRLSVLVLDDGSTDATASIVARIAGEDARVRLLAAPDSPVPRGWLGKPWACARLADAADGTILVFVDADVVLHPHAVRAAAGLLRGGRFSLVAPYPRQLADTWLERLVQPLVTWSWLATLPLRWAENSSRPSLSAANGQFLVFDSAGYRAVGGHRAVRGDVIEDVALMRALKVDGQRTTTVDGSHLAECRMYDGASAVVDGYGKSLWAAFGGPAGSAAVSVGLLATFVLPAVAAVVSRDRVIRRWGRIGYLAGVASRAAVARRTGESVVGALAHPASIIAFTSLNAVSWTRHLRGGNTWKGRPVTPRTAP